MSSLRAGEQLDHYRIDSLAARSGMASIFRGVDTRNGREVAIKVPHPEMEADPVLYDRFLREQAIGVALDHPGVMKVFEDADRSSLYMVMEWVPGRLLRQVLGAGGRFPIERAVSITIAIAEALDYIHSQGVVHRDLKPENIMIDEADRIKLIDFGIAGKEGSRRLTFAKLSQVMGTPDYISPEQVKGRRGDGRSDIYSLGAMLYEMLTGQPPFTGNNPFAIMNDRLLNYPVPPRQLNSEISPELQEVIYRALERDPKSRYAKAREMAWDLAHLDQVGAAAERPELIEWKKRRRPWLRQIFFYIGMALIPVAIFGLLLFVAKHS
jgi:serine/threonine-protein kinase